MPSSPSEKAPQAAISTSASAATDPEKHESLPPPSSPTEDEDDIHSVHSVTYDTLRPTTSNVLRQTLSRKSTRTSWIDPGPPPDGGFKAWSQAIAGHLVVFNTWGYINSFGLFQTYYTDTLHLSPAAVSWVGSVQCFILFFVGAFSGRALDAGFFLPMYIAGAGLQLLGVFMTSLSTQYWQIFLAQGICNGLGNGLVFCPTLGLVATYFSGHRALALAITACGSTTGGVVFPAVAQQLLPRLGFGWTLRVVGFLMLALTGVILTFLRPRLPPRMSGPLVDWAAFREPAYGLFAASMFFLFWSLYFGFFYVGAFGRSALGVSYTESITLLLLMNGVGLAGRFLPAYVSDRWLGPANTMAPLAFCTSIALFAWLGVHDRVGLFVWSSVYGVFAAAAQSMFPGTLSSLTTDIKRTGTRMGMVFTVVSFACLTGPPLGGAIIDSEGGRYDGAEAWAACSFLIGSVLLVGVRVAKTGWRWKVRA